MKPITWRNLFRGHHLGATRRNRGRYLFYDDFRNAMAAGSVDGRVATPGPGTWSVTDTEDKISVTGGELSFAGGKATPVWGDPGAWGDARTRAAGLMLLGDTNAVDNAYKYMIGFDPNRTTTLNELSLYFGASGNMYCYTSVGGVPKIGSWSSATEYQSAISLRSTGGFIFIKGGAFTEWSLLYIDANRNTATLYPAISNYDATLTADNPRIPTRRWLPTPLSSDGFGSTFGTTDGLGHAEGVAGGLGSGGSGDTWYQTAATWSTSGGEVSNAPVAGAETLPDPGMEGVYTDESGGGGGTVNVAPDWDARNVETDGTDTLDEETTIVHGGSSSQYFDITEAGEGIRTTNNLATTNNWWRFDAYVYGVSGNVQLRENTATYKKSIVTPPASWTLNTVTFLSFGDRQLDIIAQGGAAEFYIDDVSLKQLTLNTLFTSIAQSTEDVYASVDITLTEGTQAGLVLNLDDADTPANFVIAYHNGTDAVLDKCVAGTYTNVISAAATYGATYTLAVRKIGTSYYLWYNDAYVGSGTISDAGIISNTSHGLFNTYATNTLDNYVCYASAGHSTLDSF
jgi:hypothetical protein